MTEYKWQWKLGGRAKKSYFPKYHTPSDNFKIPKPAHVSPGTTNDYCSLGKCLPGRLQLCFDNNVCTDDTCSAEGGCSFTPNSLSCNDGDLCTTRDTCANGICVPGTALKCALGEGDEGNPCKEAMCNPKTGECRTTNKDGPCNDGDACTLGDRCTGGRCVPGFRRSYVILILRKNSNLIYFFIF
jgi:hypothetical protein